jgi:multidrug transporter EmrE-like cation transporter
VGALILTIGDVVMKEWTISNKPVLFILGMVFYMIATAIMAISFKYKNIAVASLMFILINVLLISAISYFYFHDRFTIQELIGLVLGMAAVIMFEV